MKSKEDIIEESGFVHHSKTEDRILYYDDVLDVMERYATEAVKADRERIKKKFDDCEYADHVIDGINNLPVELK